MEKPRLLHVINAFRARPGHHLDKAQRITFHSLRAARETAAAQGVDLEQVAVVFPNELDVVPQGIRPIPALRRTVQDVGTFKDKRPLPLLRDILDAVREERGFTHVIYTNIDVSLQPEFYVRIDEVIRKAGDRVPAFVVNRRVISESHVDETSYPQMCQEYGEKHFGLDCFIFPHQWLPRLDLGDVCIGILWFDLTLMASLDALSGHRSIVFRNLHWTFHLGWDFTGWGQADELTEFNRAQCLAAVRSLKQKGLFRGLASREGYLYSKAGHPTRRPILAKASVTLRDKYQLWRLHRATGLTYS